MGLCLRSLLHHRLIHQRVLCEVMVLGIMWGDSVGYCVGLVVLLLDFVGLLLCFVGVLLWSRS